MRPSAIWLGLLALVVLFVLALTCSGCKAAGQASDTIHHAGDQLQAWSEENPALDELTQGGVSAVVLLLYSVAATFQIFRERRRVSLANSAIREIIDDPAIPLTVDTAPVKAKPAIRKALQ